MMKNIIKEIDGKKYYLVDSFIEVRGDKRIKNSFWRTLDDKSHIEFECKIPEGCKDIDLESLRADCLNGEPNEESLIK